MDDAIKVILIVLATIEFIKMCYWIGLYNNISNTETHTRKNTNNNIENNNRIIEQNETIIENQERIIRLLEIKKNELE